MDAAHKHQHQHSADARCEVCDDAPQEYTLPPEVLAKAAQFANVSVSEQDILTLRSMLPPELQRLADDATCARFVRATGGRLPQSAKRLQATLLWRLENKPEHMVCHHCLKDPRSHYMHVVGYDQLKRPIIYSCLAAATNTSAKGNQEHMIQTFETAIKCMPPGVEQWVWVCDIHGFGLSDVSPRTAKMFLDISAEHYPERLGNLIMVDAPKLFGMLWKAISPFVDPKTYTKIKFLPYDAQEPKSQIRNLLAQLCDAPTTEWLLSEMAENRDSKKLEAKTYSMTHIHKSASSGDLLVPLPAGQHDVRGSRALLQTFISSPTILEPQATAHLTSRKH